MKIQPINSFVNKTSSFKGKMPPEEPMVYFNKKKEEEEPVQKGTLNIMA